MAFTSMFDAVNKVQDQAEEVQAMQALQEPTQAGAATVAPLDYAAGKMQDIVNVSDEKLQRATNILQAVASIIAIIYFVNSLLKK